MTIDVSLWGKWVPCNVQKRESGDDFYGIQTIANIGSFYEDDDDYSYMEVNTMVTG